MEEDLKKINEAMKTLRAEHEKGVKANQEVIDKCHKALDGFEGKNQALVKQITAAENESRQLKEDLKVLDKTICRISSLPGGKKASYKDSIEYKTLQAFVAKGEKGLSAEQKALLATDDNSQGGFTLQTAMSADILKQVEEISPIRPAARKFLVKTKTLGIPIRTSIPTATFEGEREAGNPSASKYKLENLTAHAQDITTPITRDLINFSAFDMVGNMTQDAVLGFAQSENRLFLQGSGHKQPEGILVNAAVISGSKESAGSGVVSLDDVIQLGATLKQGYKGKYYFNKQTLAVLRTEKDSNGNYLWAIGGERLPMEINGDNYIIAQDMPDIAAGALPIIFADLFMGYTILDSIAMEVVRDEVTRKTERIIEYTWFRWLTGQVTIAEAIKALKVKA